MLFPLMCFEIRLEQKWCFYAFCVVEGITSTTGLLVAVCVNYANRGISWSTPMIAHDGSGSSWIEVGAGILGAASPLTFPCLPSLPPASHVRLGKKTSRQCAVSAPISAAKLSQCHIPHHRISLERQSTQHSARHSSD